MMRVLISVALLSACTDSQQALQTPAQVVPWADQVRRDAQAHAQNVQQQQSAALLTLAVPADVPQVFVAAEPVATAGKKPPEVVKINGVTQAQPIVSNDAWTAPPPVAVDVDLSQAAAHELKYAGSMTQGDTTQGLVKVGARLYWVRVGDAIGLGRWRVVQLDAHSMSVQMAQKVVVYDKN